MLVYFLFTSPTEQGLHIFRQSDGSQKLGQSFQQTEALLRTGRKKVIQRLHDSLTNLIELGQIILTSRIRCKIPQKAGAALDVGIGHILGKTVYLHLRQLAKETGFEKIEQIFRPIIVALDPLQGFHKMDQRMAGHGLGLAEVIGNVKFIKEFANLELIAVHIPQENKNVLITNPVRQELANLSGHRFHFFLLVAGLPDFQAGGILGLPLAFEGLKVMQPLPEATKTGKVRFLPCFC